MVTGSPTNSLGEDPGEGELAALGQVLMHHTVHTERVG